MHTRRKGKIHTQKMKEKARKRHTQRNAQRYIHKEVGKDTHIKMRQIYIYIDLKNGKQKDTYIEKKRKIQNQRKKERYIHKEREKDTKLEKERKIHT